MIGICSRRHYVIAAHMSQNRVLTNNKWNVYLRLVVIRDITTARVGQGRHYLSEITPDGKL